MEMRQYLSDTFRFNHRANTAMVNRVLSLPDPSEGIRQISHLINSQIKWMARVRHQPDAHALSWWEPVYAGEELAARWQDSCAVWEEFIARTPEEEWHLAIWFIGQDGTPWTARLKDVALQLVYHSIHHRAQIQMLIRSQGHEPDFIDYIGTVYRKLEKHEIEAFVREQGA